MSRIHGNTFGVWIGLHFQQTSGSWIWTDNVGLTYQNWGAQKTDVIDVWSIDIIRYIIYFVIIWGYILIDLRSEILLLLKWKPG